MKNISDILEGKKIEVKKIGKINLLWEEADEFAKYVGIPTTFTLRLFKVFGKNKVLSQRSWLKDAPKDKSFNGLVYWRMKNLTE